MTRVKLRLLLIWLHALGGNFDLIVDDGSHDLEHQILTVNILARYLAPGGIFIIEDVNRDPTEIIKRLPPGFGVSSFRSHAEPAHAYVMVIATPMKIFITGVAGFLGSHLADVMLADGHKVVGIDNMLGGELANVPSGVDFHQIDCNDFTRVKELMQGCQILYHCAATAYEGLSVFSPVIVTQNIVGASVSVFAAAISNRVQRIVTCSSMARYGAGKPPFKETNECHPQDPYGIGKLAVEQLLANMCKTHGVEYVIAVPHNIIGPRQKYDDPYRNVASIMINLLLQDRRAVIYGDGTQRRCFSYIDDCLYCLHAMAFQPWLNGEVINIGPDEGAVSIKELHDTITHLLGVSHQPLYMPGRPQEVRLAFCSSDKAREKLGYSTQVSLRQGLEHMIAAIEERGPRPFKYHLDLEIESPLVPRTWKDRLF